MKVRNSANNFPVVCVGGSAGGLDAYIRLLKHLPTNMGVAIVIVNHLRTVAPCFMKFCQGIRRCRLTERSGLPGLFQQVPGG